MNYLSARVHYFPPPRPGADPARPLAEAEARETGPGPRLGGRGWGRWGAWEARESGTRAAAFLCLAHSPFLPRHSLSFWGFIARLLSLCGVVALAFATARSGSADIVRGAGTARQEERGEVERGSG